MIKRAVFIILAIVVAYTAAFIYVSTRPQEPLTVPNGAEAGDLIDLQPCTYKAGKTEYVADCGTLIVPENRSDPGSRLIALPVIRVRALNGGHAEPIFFLMGGPGRSNLHFEFLAGMVDERDFVQVGYRGIDGSSVLDCPETVDALKAADDLLSKASLDSFSASIAACAARLRGEGVDLAGYTLLERVNDLEASRLALGYEKINLLSESVGTRTALMYAQAYPESIHRSVMNGVNPPGHFFWRADVTDEQMEYYADLCARDPSCSARTDDLAETMREVARNMPERWLFIPIHPGTVKVGSFFSLFHISTKPLSAPWVIDAWLSAAEGDASGLAMLSVFSGMVFPSAFVWGETSAVGVSADLPEAQKYLADVNLENSIIGAPGSTWMWSGMLSWPATMLPEDFRQVQPSDVETLLVSGTVDVSTPARFARDELLPSLSNGQQVILAEFGHSDDVWGIQPEATARLVNSFYSTGVADVSLFTIQPIPFDVGTVGFPELFKLALGASMLVLLGLVALVWFVVQRVRRRTTIQTSVVAKAIHT